MLDRYFASCYHVTKSVKSNQIVTGGIVNQSDYIQRGYTSLHIKTETRQRLNLVAAQLRQQNGRFITQDEVLNLLLDSHGDVETKQDGPHVHIREN